MFAMEMATRWRKELTWRCFLACAISIVVVRLCVTNCVGHGHCSSLAYGSLIWFKVGAAEIAAAWQDGAGCVGAKRSWRTSVRSRKWLQ